MSRSLAEVDVYCVMDKALEDEHVWNESINADQCQRMIEWIAERLSPHSSRRLADSCLSDSDGQILRCPHLVEALKERAVRRVLEGGSAPSQPILSSIPPLDVSEDFVCCGQCEHCLASAEAAVNDSCSSTSTLHAHCVACMRHSLDRRSAPHDPLDVGGMYCASHFLDHWISRKREAMAIQAFLDDGGDDVGGDVDLADECIFVDLASMSLDSPDDVNKLDKAAQELLSHSCFLISSGTAAAPVHVLYCADCCMFDNVNRGTPLLKTVFMRALLAATVLMKDDTGTDELPSDEQRAAKLPEQTAGLLFLYRPILFNDDNINSFLEEGAMWTYTDVILPHARVCDTTTSALQLLPHTQDYPCEGINGFLIEYESRDIVASRFEALRRNESRLMRAQRDVFMSAERIWVKDVDVWYYEPVWPLGLFDVAEEHVEIQRVKQWSPPVTTETALRPAHGASLFELLFDLEPVADSSQRCICPMTGTSRDMLVWQSLVHVAHVIRDLAARSDEVRRCDSSSVLDTVNE